ncbi:hypothetical protein [Prevotella sp. MGM2]|nr:hypothetical protein [Prevotella sp. MGM2]
MRLKKTGFYTEKIRKDYRRAWKTERSGHYTRTARTICERHAANAT